jgi:hypothetical protein
VLGDFSRRWLVFSVSPDLSTWQPAVRGGEMADAGFFRGTNSEQDSRFFNKTKKLMKSMKFPPNINTKVDMSKVNMDVVKPWITKRVTEILGFEDDVVIEFIFNLFEGNQVNLTFLHV